MSKFCANCGAQQPDEANVCGNCGNAFATENVGGANVGEMIKEKKSLIIAAVAVILVLVLLFSSCGGGYKKAVDNLFDVQFKGKANKIEKLAPKEFWDYVEDENDNFDKKDMIENYEEAWEDNVDDIEDEYGKNFKVSYKIVDKDELSEKKLKDLKDALNETYDIKRKDVKKAMKLDIEYKIKGREDEDEDEIEDLIVVKIGGKWYPCSEGGYFAASGLTSYGMSYDAE